MSTRRKRSGTKRSFAVIWPDGGHTEFDTLEAVYAYVLGLIEEHGFGHA